MFAKLLEFLARIFDPNGIRNGEAPAVEVTHPVLGVIRWSKDDESWFGSYRDFRFSLGYEGQVTPSDPLIAYALEVMDDPGWLESSFEAARVEAIRTFEAYYTDEIRGLTLGPVHFFRGRAGTLGFSADAEGGRDYRCWFSEYEGRHCYGLGL